ncbi:rRNA maturation RNase YbeY [Chloroflexota bacterium]
MQLGVQIDDRFRENINEKWLYKIVELCLKIHKFDYEVELSLFITGDETVRDINQKYRGMDETTDVLSFALTEEGSDISQFILPPDGISHLGEVIISYPRAVMQAEKADHDVEQEMALLIIHGILHLLGYDHNEPDREIEMRGLERKILNDLTRELC